jgi:hypothetical protein
VLGDRQVFPKKGSLLTCSPAGQTARDHRDRLLAVPTARPTDRLQDNATESRQSPHRGRPGLRVDQLHLLGQLREEGCLGTGWDEPDNGQAAQGNLDPILRGDRFAHSIRQW